MAEQKPFEPITTQEAFNAAISARLERERTSLAAKYGDYDTIKSERDTYAGQITTLQGDLADRDKTISDLQAQVQGYETASVKTRCALAAGLPYSMAERLQGSTEQEITADAQALAKMMAPKPAAPLRTTADEGDLASNALLALANNLTT